MSRITFIDTSVLCDLLAVPGKAQAVEEVRRELKERAGKGERFILPMSTIIETGNHVEQAVDNREAAEAFTDLVRAAIRGGGPFQANAVTWDTTFLGRMLDGASTGGVTFTDLATTHQLGTGDIAILVERDRFVDATAFRAQDVGIWTHDAKLAAYT